MWVVLTRMKICTCCSAQNRDDAFKCKVCGEKVFYTKHPAGAQRKVTTAVGRIRAALSSRSTWVLICVCLTALSGEVVWRQIHLSRLVSELAAERTTVSSDRAAAFADQKRVAQFRLDREEAEHQSLLLNTAWLSGSLARERHEKEWALRIAHDPRLANTVLETNILTMEQLGQDATLAAQTALEKVARLASPRDSRVEVTPAGDGFRVRVAFMMSRLSINEAGAVTKHHTVASMQAEIQELSARVLRDLYEYCSSRDITSISVTCNHTVLQSMVPEGATAEEQVYLLRRAHPAPARLYRLSLNQSRAQSIVDWRRVPLSRVIALCTVEYDGLAHLTIRQNPDLNQDKHDPQGELQF